MTAKKAKKAKKGAKRSAANKGGRPRSQTPTAKTLADRRRKQGQLRRQRAGLSKEPDPATDEQLALDAEMLASTNDADLSAPALADRMTLVELASMRATARWRQEKARKEKLSRLEMERALIPLASYLEALQGIAGDLRRAADSAPALLAAVDAEPEVQTAAKDVLAKVMRRFLQIVSQSMHDHTGRLRDATDE
jgi:hypothetical protein